MASILGVQRGIAAARGKNQPKVEAMSTAFTVLKTADLMADNLADPKRS